MTEKENSKSPTAAAAVPAGGDAVKLLFNVYHAAFHFLDNAGLGPEPDDMQVDPECLDALNKALEAVEIAFPPAREAEHVLLEQFAPAPRGGVTERPTHWRYYSPRGHKGNKWESFADKSPEPEYTIDYGFTLTPAAQAQDAERSMSHWEYARAIAAKGAK